MASQFRLGLGWRLRRVDPSGRLGLAKRLLSGPRLVSLKTGAWIALRRPKPKAKHELGETFPLTHDTVLTEIFERVGSGDSAVMVPRGYIAHTLSGVLLATVPSTSDPSDKKDLCIAADGSVAARALPSESVQWFDLKRLTEQTLRLESTKVVQSIACSAGDNSVLAVGRWGEISTYQIDGTGHTPRVPFSIPNEDIRWIGIAGRRLVALIDAGGHGLLICLTLDRSGQLIAEEKRIAIPQYFEIAALSDDGRYIAIGSDSGDINLVSLETEEIATLTGHSDAISCLQFPIGSAELIGGDCDNRVARWPLSPVGPHVFSLNEAKTPTGLVSLADRPVPKAASVVGFGSKKDDS